MRGRGETVLLAEDKPAQREVGKLLLKSLGYKVIESGSPREIIRLASDTRATSC